MKQLLYILLLISLALPAYAQSPPPVVINEFANGTEFTEILITKDGYSLVGLWIGDSGQGANELQNVAEFKDVPIFQNMAAGTILVIYGTGQSSDTDDSDGYLEVGLDDANLFRFVDRDGNPITREKGGSMDFNDHHEIVWIRNNKVFLPTSQPDHVHALAFLNGLFTIYDQIPGPKLAHASSGPHIFVIPGETINDYIDATPSDLGKHAKVNGNRSIGFPNIMSDYKIDNLDMEAQLHNKNQIFWRKLRSPYSDAIANHSWKSGSIGNMNAVRDKLGVSLTWTKTSTNLDENKGYLIIRYELQDASKLIDPVDCVTYQKGEKLGPATVVANVTTWNSSSWVDPIENLECGQIYKYRVYLYRFDPDDQGKDGRYAPEPAGYTYAKPLNARGRMYGSIHVEQGEMQKLPFAESNEVSKSDTEIPVLSAEDDIESVCVGDVVRIYADVKGQNNMDYSWLMNGVEISKQNSEFIEYTFDKPGSFRFKLVLTNEFDCEAESQFITIKAHALPTAFIGRFTPPTTVETFLNDTTIELCGNEIIILTSLGKEFEEFWWIRDSIATPIDIGSNTYEIDKSRAGTYRIVANNGNTCFDTSHAVTVIFRDPKFTISPQSIVFANNGDSETFTITNDDSRELVFTDADHFFNTISGGNGDFVILNPKFPVTIMPGESREFTVRFFRVEFGTSQADLQFDAPCDLSHSINLKGDFEDTGETIVFSIPAIDFGVVPNCADSTRLLKFDLIVAGTDAVSIAKPPSQYIDILSPTTFPIVLNPGESQPVEVELIPMAEGNYIETVKFDYTIVSDGETKATSIEVTGIVEMPELILSESLLDFSEKITCVNYIDTTITMSNPTLLDITADPVTSNVSVDFPNGSPYEILAGESIDIDIRIYIDDIPNTKNISFTISPCGAQSESIELIMPKDQLMIGFKDGIDSIDFGKINQCRKAGEIRGSVTLTVNKPGAFIKRAFLVDNRDFSINDYSNLALTDGLELEVTFKDNGDGIFEDELRIVILPCSDTLSVSIRGERITPDAPVFDVTVIDFGTLDLNQPALMTLSITNPNPDYDIVLNEIQSLIAPFSCTSHDLISDFPLTIAAGMSVTFELQFLSAVALTEDMPVTFDFTEPCSWTQQVRLIALSQDMSNRQIALSFRPDNFTAEIGTRFNVPIYLETQDDLASAGISDLVIGVSYNPSVIVPVSASKGEFFNGENPLISINESIMGEAELSMSLQTGLDLQSGEWAVVTFEALLGNALNTDLIINSAEFESEIPVNMIEADTAMIELTGDCDIESRLLEIGDASSIEINNPVTANTNFIVRVTNSDELTLSLYNSFGGEVTKYESRSIQPGQYNYKLNADNLASGVYYLVLRQGRFSTMRKVVLIK